VCPLPILMGSLLPRLLAQQRHIYGHVDVHVTVLMVTRTPTVGCRCCRMHTCRAPFMVTGAAAFVAALYGLIRLPETRSKEARQVLRPSRFF